MRILTKIFISLALATAFVVASAAEERYQIRGTVVDEEGYPLPGASVAIVGTTIGAGTNADGEFVIVVRTSSPLQLCASFTGYQPMTQDVNPASAQSVAFNLEPALNEKEEVIVTGTRVAKPLKETPILTRVVGQKAIQSLNPMSIETLLQYELPGLQIVYNSMSQLPEIKYQGVDGEYVLFLVDGERISGEGADHNVDFTRFNVDEIERIEVIRGSQSAVYGSNALGCVINIITKNATRPFTGNVSARYAGSNGNKFSASVGTKQNRFTSLTSATYRTRDTYTVGDEEGQTTVSVDDEGNVTESVSSASTTTVYGYDIYDVAQKFGYAFTDKLSADLKGSYYHNKRAVRGSNKYQDYFIDYAVNAKLKYLIADNQQINGSYVFDNYKKDKNFFALGYVRTDYRNKNNTARVDYSGTFGRHTLSSGVEGDWEYLKHYMMKDSADASVQTYSLYLQEDWKAAEGLDVVASVRGDYHKKYHLHVTPKISIMYNPIEILTLRLGYSQGFRSPSLKELYQEYDMGGLGIMMLYGNEDLKPETSHQISVSAEVTKGIWNASASLYHNRFNNKIAYASLGDDSSDMQYVNAENAKTTGVEAILQTRLELGLTMTAAYAYVNDYEEVNGKNTSSVRPHSITFNAMYQKRFGKIACNASLNGQWTSKLDTYSFSTSDNSYSYVSYRARTLCSMNVGATFPRGISASLGVDNLFNYKDKASDSSLQLPQTGISLLATLGINLADLFGL